MRTQREDRHLQATESGLRRQQLCGHLYLRLLVSRSVRKYISVVSVLPPLWPFVKVAQANLNAASNLHCQMLMTANLTADSATRETIISHLLGINYIY